MARQRECQVCKKQLTSKYWLITGYPSNSAYKASRANYCASCCDKISKEPLGSDLFKKQLERGWIKIIEKEAGNKMDDEISEFEDKWEKHNKLGITKKNLPNKKTFLNSIQKAHAELEPYLQKPEIVEKAWEKEYNTDIDMTFYYLFAKKSAREKDYKQKVVQPTIEEILGSKLDEEINTTTTGNSPGVPGRADGDFKIDNKLIGKYNWVDHEDDCRRLALSFWDDNKLALQAYLRALAIKEKELTGNTKPIETDNPPHQEKISSNSTNQPKLTNWTLIIVLGIAGIVAIVGLVIYFLKKPKSR